VVCHDPLSRPRRVVTSNRGGRRNIGGGRYFDRRSGAAFPAGSCGGGRTRRRSKPISENSNQETASTPPCNNTGAEVAVAHSGRFVYGSKRGHYSIAIFAVDHAQGTLTPVGWEPTQGQTPRFFTLDPAANSLSAANQDTDTVVTFRANPGTGRLAPTGQVVKVGSPVGIIVIAS
jgi:DNA-binding beta-propeller fold protein YncE